MIRISKLTGISMDDLMQLGNPAFEVKGKYELNRSIDSNEILFSLKYKEISGKFSVKIYTNSSEDKDRYNKLITEENSFAAYDDDKFIGFVITEERRWNNSLWVDMIQVAKPYRGKGVGTQLLNALEHHATTEKYRIIEIETQNTNIPAMNFYKKNGYNFSGLNMALYDPEEVNDEFAIFMAKNLK